MRIQSSSRVMFSANPVAAAREGMQVVTPVAAKKLTAKRYLRAHGQYACDRVQIMPEPSQGGRELSDVQRRRLKNEYKKTHP